MSNHMVLSRTLALALVLAAASTWACDDTQPTATPVATPTAAPTATSAPTTPTSPPTPLPTPVSLAPPTPTRIVISEPYDPCGPSEGGHHFGPRQEGFLHWRGDGSLLVFDQNDTVWTLEIEGGTILRVADADANFPARTPSDSSGYRFLYGFYADVSPDGSRIIYSSCEFLLDQPKDSMHSEGYELVMMNVDDVDGSGKHRLTDNARLDHYPAWSPDGEHIAFVKYEGYEPAFYPQIHERRKQVRLATRSRDLPGIPLLPTSNVALYPPVWSPDSQTLAYIVDEGEFTNELVVWTIGLGDREPAPIGAAVSPPTWSPDGEELAFVSVEGEEVVVYAARPDGTEHREVWRGAGDYGQAHWSPDGSEILVVTYQAYLVSADGGEQRALAHERPLRNGYHTSPVSQAAWSPDGSMIALRDELSISMVSRDGTALRVLAEADRNGWLRAVQPAPPEATTEPVVGSPDPVPTESPATARAQ